MSKTETRKYKDTFHFRDLLDKWSAKNPAGRFSPDSDKVKYQVKSSVPDVKIEKIFLEILKFGIYLCSVKF